MFVKTTDPETRDYLIKAGFTLLDKMSTDKTWIFRNDGKVDGKFSFQKAVFTNKLNF